MQKKILNNWPLKLLSIAIAVLVWFVVMSYADPTEKREIAGIPIEIVNDDVITGAGKSYQISSSLTASIRVVAPSSVVRGLNADDFEATADFSKMHDLTNQVPIEVTSVNRKVSAGQIQLLTDSIKIEIENVISRQYYIEIYTEGEPAEGYMIGNKEVSPQVVTVSAPESLIDKIMTVRVSVNTESVSQKIQDKAQIMFLDSKGNELDLSERNDVSLSNTEADVSVEILNMKTLNIAYSVSGQDQVKDGYRYTEAKLSQNTVTVSGLKSVLAGVSSIVIPEEELSVAGASENVEYHIDLQKYLPDGVKVVKRSEEVLNVILVVESLVEQEYDLLNELKLSGEDDAYEYTVENTSLKTKIQGLQADLNQLTADAVIVEADVSDLTPGTYELEAAVQVPGEGYKIIKTDPVRIRVTAKTVGTESTGTEETGESSDEHRETTSADRP